MEKWCCSAQTEQASQPSSCPVGRRPPPREKPWNVRNVLEPPAGAPGQKPLGSSGPWGLFPREDLPGPLEPRELIPDNTFWHWGQASATSNRSQVLSVAVAGAPAGLTPSRPSASHPVPAPRGLGPGPALGTRKRLKSQAEPCSEPPGLRQCGTWGKSLHLSGRRVPRVRQG